MELESTNKHCSMITEILKKVNKNKNIEPMSAEEISQIQLAKNRTNPGSMQKVVGD